MRNISKKADLEIKSGDALNKTLFIRELDICKSSTFEPVLDEIIKNEGTLDIVIQNAGVPCVAMLETLSETQIRSVIETNLIGPILLSQRIVPILKKQKSGHVIVISSQAGYIGVPYNEIYSASKFGIEGFSEGLAAQLAIDNVHFSLIEPGPVLTDIAKKVGSECRSAIASAEVDEVTRERFTEYLTSITAKFHEVVQQTEDVADVIIKALNDENPHLRYQTSQYQESVAMKKLVDITGDSNLNHMLKHLKDN
ncbi:retinol dehydrogenase 8-like [Anneissia japonica]|uniref:retinol dehydrogenase 8-like n=1 Tax=Anneissia japonica TaxID=1529436 RepID=UPI0014255467|nr:retinol dehydrogenase 8-like [Anneissia japonica]